MRLLDTSKIELHEFFDAQIPEYAILSHRWEDGEVTFQLFQSREGLEMAGYQKIRNFCAKAALDGWEYVVSLLNRCSGDLVNKLGVLSGSTPVVLINQAVLNSLKQSIPCTNGMRMHKSAMHIYPMWLLIGTWNQPCVSVSGLPEGGHYKSF
jgi:hypothetical protein